MGRRILVTGASIAGNSSAYWLARYGFDVTVVERAPQFRDGGQNVDVRGAGREVLRRMGLEHDAMQAGTGEAGTAWVDEDGKDIARFDTDDAGPNGITAELEILRGDLAKLLYDAACQQKASYRFGDKIASLVQAADGGDVTVTFASGETARYDSVIIAEGVGSGTRDMVLPDLADTRWMDVLIAYFSVPSQPSDTPYWLWYHTTGGRSASLRPGSENETMAILSIQKPAAGEHKWSEDRQKSFLRESFRDVGWQTPRILDGMDKAEWFYFDALRQIRLSKWFAGRVVITGDAAWCATPLAGIGTTLALVGGYVIAGELARATHPQDAFAAYETFMRPIVKAKQNVPKILPRLFNPHSAAGLALFRTMLRTLSLPGIKGPASKLFLGASLDVELPDYQTALTLKHRSAA